MQTITKHYIGEKFLESHGHEVMDIVNAASQILAGRVTINGLLGDQRAPVGGFKHSGGDREFGKFGRGVSRTASHPRMTALRI